MVPVNYGLIHARTASTGRVVVEANLFSVVGFARRLPQGATDGSNKTIIVVQSRFGADPGRIYRLLFLIVPGIHQAACDTSAVRLFRMVFGADQRRRVHRLVPLQNGHYPCDPDMWRRGPGT